MNPTRMILKFRSALLLTVFLNLGSVPLSGQAAETGSPEKDLKQLVANLSEQNKDLQAQLKALNQQVTKLQEEVARPKTLFDVAPWISLCALAVIWSIANSQTNIAQAVREQQRQQAELSMQTMKEGQRTARTELRMGKVPQDSKTQNAVKPTQEGSPKK